MLRTGCVVYFIPYSSETSLSSHSGSVSVYTDQTKWINVVECAAILRHTILRGSLQTAKGRRVSMRIVRGDQMVQGNWVGDPVSLFFFLLVFYCSSPPFSASISVVGVEGFALCPDPLSLHSSSSLVFSS